MLCSSSHVPGPNLHGNSPGLSSARGCSACSLHALLPATLAQQPADLTRVLTSHRPKLLPEPPHPPPTTLQVLRPGRAAPRVWLGGQLREEPAWPVPRRPAARGPEPDRPGASRGRTAGGLPCLKRSAWACRLPFAGLHAKPAAERAQHCPPVLPAGVRAAAALAGGPQAVRPRGLLQPPGRPAGRPGWHALLRGGLHRRGHAGCVAGTQGGGTSGGAAQRTAAAGVQGTRRAAADVQPWSSASLVGGSHAVTGFSLLVFPPLAHVHALFCRPRGRSGARRGWAAGATPPRPPSAASCWPAGPAGRRGGRGGESPGCFSPCAACLPRLPPASGSQSCCTHAAHCLHARWRHASA